MDKTEITQQIKEEAKLLGFPLVGVTHPNPPIHIDFFQNWLSKGYHASMDWIASQRSQERRSDPLIILPECKSILVLGTPYPAPMGNIKGGNIAAYALSQDYHLVIETRLKALMKKIDDLVGRSVPNRWYVDTGPILERELAMRAGLGWIGKNTTLINQDLGSYFFLAEILLGIELDLDPPITETYCGTCTRCLDTCPTNALEKPYTLNAGRCISYLTIEHRGEIPLNLRSKMGDWVFGCDICQIVCPWNKPEKASPEILEDLQPKAEYINLVLTEQMELNQDQFSTYFKGSPIKRTKRRGFLRNVAIVLGNLRHPDALPVLQKALNDEEVLIQEAAAWAIDQIKHAGEEG
jgi:epoxyqueuosine reductase